MNGVSLLNNFADLSSAVTYVLNLYDLEIYERTWIIWDRTWEYASAFESTFNQFVSRIERRPTTRSYKMGSVCVFIDCNCSRLFMELCAVVMVQSIRSPVQWSTPPPPPFRDCSNWSLPLTRNPIERKRLLYLTVKTHLYLLCACVLFATYVQLPLRLMKC